jgi:hypothetical protein
MCYAPFTFWPAFHIFIDDYLTTTKPTALNYNGYHALIITENDQKQSSVYFIGLHFKSVHFVTRIFNFLRKVSEIFITKRYTWRRYFFKLLLKGFILSSIKSFFVRSILFSPFCSSSSRNWFMSKDVSVHLCYFLTAFWYVKWPLCIVTMVNFKKLGVKTSRKKIKAYKGYIEIHFKIKGKDTRGCVCVCVCVRICRKS